MNFDNRITVNVYGADWCGDCVRAKAFLNENQIQFEFIDVDLDEAATRKVEKMNKGKRIIPMFEIGSLTLTNPDNQKLARVFGINDVGRIILMGADWCPDCRRAKGFLQDNNINFQYVDIEQHDWANGKIEELNNGKRVIPTVVIGDKAHINPDNAKLSELLKIEVPREDKLFDVVIIGAGAAGLTASIYCQRDKLDSIILEKKNIGGNAFLTEKIENYPGFTSISGPELMERMANQTKTYGAKIEQGTEVKKIIKKADHFQVETNLGEIRGKSIVIATGSTYRQLNIPGEKELIGSGVHFCATCDGAFYRDKEVLVIGGGNSALEEGIFLSGFCAKVTIINNLPEFTASKTYIDKLPTIDNIETRMDTTSLEFLADERGLFNALKVQNNSSEEIETITADGVFVFIGLVPNTDFLNGFVELDERNFVVTECGTVQTSVDGVLVAGDCRRGAVAQVAAATGEGVMASYGIRRFLTS
jgi:thioredoxin reductase (NADPH)